MKKAAKKIIVLVLICLMVLTSLPLNSFAAEGDNAPVPWDGEHQVSGEIDTDNKAITISTGENLFWLCDIISKGNNLSEYVVSLTADIDLGGHEWTPIGKTMATAFRGSFCGNGHTISNFTVSKSIDAANIINSPYHAVGLFGVCADAQISDLILDNISISIRNESGYQNSYSSVDGTNVFAGALCGYASNVVFDNIYVTNSSVTAYTGAESASAYAGGICGYAKNSFSFSYCSMVSGSVSGTSSSAASGNAHAGGIVGCAVGEGAIRQCMNGVNVSGGHSVGGAYTGGIAGKTESSATALSTIIDCYNTGIITHSGSWLETGGVGGIVGYASSSILYCYNSGSVIASTNTVGGTVAAGGIAGTGINATIISNCVVLSPQISGGTVNYMISSVGNKSNNFASNAIAGSPTNDATARYNLSEFNSKTLFEQLGWNFSDIWGVDDNGNIILLVKKNSTDNTISAVWEAINGLNIIFANNDSYNRVTQNVGLPTTAKYTDSKGKEKLLDVVWTSSNNSIVSVPDGTVTRTNADSLVKLTATITLDDYTRSKIFTLNILNFDTPENVEPVYWGMNIDDARDLVALIRGCKFKDVSADDQDVLVLIGADIVESHVIDTVAKVIEFYEVPCESAYLRSRLGVVKDLIKSGTDAEYDALLSDFSDGLVKYKDDNVVVSGEKVASKLLAIPNAAFDVKMNLVDAYSKGKKSAISINTHDDVVDQALSNGKKLGGIMDFVVKVNGDSFPNLGNIFGTIKNGYDLWQLAKAFGVAKKDATNAYLKMYLENRGNYQSADDSTFQLIMDMHRATSIKGDIENIDAIAESLYLLNKKFCGIEDEYKIIIQCPVDVYIYDSTGAIVGRVIDNVVDTSIMNSLKITVGGNNNDEKTIYIQDEEEYSIQLIGNDSGSMDITIGYDNGAEVNYNLFTDIPLENGKTMITSVSLADVENNTAQNIYETIDGVITEDFEAIDNVQKEYLFDSDDVTFHLDGTAELSSIGGKTTTGYISAGTQLNDLAHAKYGYVFAGYYTDLDCLVAYTANYMPEENLHVYAKYVEVDTEIEFMTQPMSANYRQDDVAIPLNVEIACPENYTVSYQWYMIKADGTEISIDGANSDSYMPDINELGTKGYYVIVTAVNASTNKQLVSRSNTATINVTEHLIIANGTCGDNFTWVIYENNELKISGTGEMSEWSSVEDVPWHSYKSDIESVIIENGITSISSNAFAGFSNVTEITVPTSVVIIGESAFSGCTSLESITLPFIGSSREANGTYDAVLGYIFGRVPSSTSNAVGQYYESSNGSLSGYYYAIPATLKSITITDAQIIPFGSFSNCSSLNVIVLNSGIESISSYAFYNCSSLSELSIPNTVVNVGENALAGCNGIQKLTVPFVGSSRNANNTYDSVLGHIFGRASDGTAQYCTLNGTSISYYYYAIPNSLKNIIITDATQIPFGAFCNCSNIETITFNSRVVSVDGYSFYNCSVLSEISLPESVTEIKSNAFNGCSSLSKITIYSKTCYIYNSASTIESSATIYGYRNSTANTYANTFSRNFVALDDMHEHSFNITDSVESDCVNDGYVVYTCECGESYTETVAKLDHNYSSEWTIDKEASCSEEGSKSHHCIRCNAKSDITTIAKTEHVYAEIITAPTCTEDGYTTYTCSNCGYNYDGNHITKLGHSFGWITDKEPTCGATGIKHEECSVCHTKKSENTVVAAMGNHNYASTITAPTCTTGGYTTYVCSTCGNTYVDDTVEKIAHSWAWITDKDPTCNANGLKHEECSVCHEKQNINTVITSTGEHTYSAVVTNPTCTSKGYTTYTCSGCGTSYVDDETDTTAHSWGWIIDKEPTCGATGLKHEKCANCNATQSEDTIIEATGNHTWKWIEDKTPTCGEVGYKHQECIDCNAIQNNNTEISATGLHAYDTVVTTPTCTEDGYSTFTCSICQYSYVGNKVSKTNHSWTWIVDKDATCGENGIKHEKCSKCSAVQSENTIIPATGKHAYGDAIVVTEATCTSTGKKVSVCSVCSYELEENIAKINHIDANNDCECDSCGYKIEIADPSANCSCNCHKSGIVNFFWKIINFFHKIFKMEKYHYCNCGNPHW